MYQEQIIAWIKGHRVPLRKTTIPTDQPTAGQHSAQQHKQEQPCCGGFGTRRGALAQCTDD